MPQAGKTLELLSIIVPDNEATGIANTWLTWDRLREPKKSIWKELHRYISATDTSTTTNAALPWKNTTTLPKLTQVRDNLYANYMATAFPSDRWLDWEGATEEDDTKAKAQAIKAYMGVAIDQQPFKSELSRMILDYIDYGNVFGIPKWIDERVYDNKGKEQFGWVGPGINRISPFDIVFNPTARSFQHTPKIVRSIITLGDLRDELLQDTHDEGELEAAKELWNYLREMRYQVRQYGGDLSVENDIYQVEGFTSFQEYLNSNYAEVLTFYGDYYDTMSDTFYKNHIIKVVDRHKLFYKKPNPSGFGYPPIFHCGWRTLQDNLWAMGPLENLIGMQYRLDHIENLKADLFDLVTFPPVLIKGYVPEFTWGPLEKIVTDKDGEVELLKPDVAPLQANFEIKNLTDTMEEMAGAPKQALGFRTPGEKTKYEVQSLESAAARVFQSKITQFEILYLEPLLNAMLEMARRLMNSTVVRVIDDELKIAEFLTLSPEDIAGAGKIKPIAARHFAEKSQMIQNLSQFYGSGIGQDEMVRAHLSSLKLAQVFEELLEVGKYKIFAPYVRISEQGEAERFMAQEKEQTMMHIQTPAGISPEDANQPFQRTPANQLSPEQLLQGGGQ